MRFELHCAPGEIAAARHPLPSCNATRLSNERMKKRYGGGGARARAAPHSRSRSMLNTLENLFKPVIPQAALIYPQIPALITAYRDLIKGEVR